MRVAIKRLNASEDERHDGVTLDSSPLRLSASRRATSLPPLRHRRRRHAAFMPHYRRFETHHGGPMSFFIALLLATRLPEDAQRALQKVPPPSDCRQKAADCSFNVAAEATEGCNQVAFSKKLSLNLTACAVFSNAFFAEYCLRFRELGFTRSGGRRKERINRRASLLVSIIFHPLHSARNKKR